MSDRILSGAAAAVVLGLAILCAPPAWAQGSSANQDSYRQQMRSVMQEMKDATTPEQREAARARMKQLRAQWQAAHPAKAETAADEEARRQKMEAQLKKNPYMWQMYQLRQSKRNATTPEQKASIQAQMTALSSAHQAQAEAQMTPKQKADEQAREAKRTQMRAAMEPLMKELREATTPEEKKAIRERMRALMKRFN